MSALTTSGEHPVNWFDTALEIRADLEQVAIMVKSVAGHNSGHAQHEPTTNTKYRPELRRSLGHPYPQAI